MQVGDYPLAYHARCIGHVLNVDVMGGPTEGVLSVFTPVGHQLMPLAEFTQWAYERMHQLGGFEWPLGRESDLTAISEWLLCRGKTE